MSPNLVNRMRETWKRLDPTDTEVDPVATANASLLLAEALVVVEDHQAEHDALLRGRVPTHRCKVCGALWIEYSDSWSLFSRRCGKCCDNAPMGKQIEPLPGIPPRLAPEPTHELPKGAVPVLNPQGTGETGTDRPAAPAFDCPHLYGSRIENGVETCNRCAKVLWRAPETCGGWQPIATVPRDNRPVLVWLTEPLMGSNVVAARFHERVSTVGNLFEFDAPKATHWRPQLEPPETTGAKS